MDFSSIRCKSNTLVLTCLCLIVTICSVTQAIKLPWESDNPIKDAISQPDGSAVICEGVTVEKIAARNNPAYFVVSDPCSNKIESKIVVLSRAPLTLGDGQTVCIQGTMGTLPSGERCILNPVIEGYFDSNGRQLYWMPMFSFLKNISRQVLPVPDSPIPPSDPSLPDDGIGISGTVSVSSTNDVLPFATISSLIGADPAVLNQIELSCKPIKSTGNGYIVVGDDTTGSTIKVYTNTEVKPDDRIIKLTGTVHTENGNLVIYADCGPSPYFDHQGVGGGVSVASPGSVAYAGTLNDATNATSASTGIRLAGISTPTSSNGSWVYLTGQVVTFVGKYFSYDITNQGWMNVYNIQGIDRASGIRVWNPANGPSYVGSVVDVMAKVDTKDGQRILGIWNSETYSAIDQTLTSLCIEPQVLVQGDQYSSLNITPVGMNNRALGGMTMGNNPGIINTSKPNDPYGLYNIGSYVTVWGKVLECGPRWDADSGVQIVWPYQFNQNTSYTTPYMRIDDGSCVPTGNSSYGGPYCNQGVVVFSAENSDCNWQYSDGANIQVGDYVSVTGVSSIWQPNGSANTYRSIWTPYPEIKQASSTTTLTTRQIASTGTISGVVKLYDMPVDLPNNQAKVTVMCSNGSMTTLNIVRQSDGSGSAPYTFTVPQEVTVTSYGQENPYIHSEYPKYIISAKCENYKTRTYTNITPWTGAATPRNIYLTRLRKIYVTTNNLTIGSEAEGSDPTSTIITATVRDANHSPVSGIMVRFRTNKGAFSNGSHEYVPVSATNSNGQVTATLYAVPAEWGGDVIVEATDDSAPLVGDDANDDPYKYDWQRLHDSCGQPCNITVNTPSTNLEITASPISIDICGSILSEIKAHVTGCNGADLDGVDVTFTTSDPGRFSDNSTQKTVTTTGGGYATVYLKGNGNSGTATVYASAYPYGIYTSTQAPAIKITTDTLTFTSNPIAGQIGQSVTVIVNVKDAAGNNVPEGRTVYFSQTGGDGPESGSDTTDNSGNAHWTVVRSALGKVSVIASEYMSCGNQVTETADVWFFDTAADDWPMFMHDGQHTGMSNTWDVSSESLSRQWVVNVPTASTSRQGSWSVNINQTTSVQHPHPCISAAIFEHPYIDSSPVVVGNRVVVGAWNTGNYMSSTGSVKAFDAANNGAVLWTATGNPAMGGIASTPCIANGKVYIGSANGYLYCLDLVTGNQIWARQTTNRSASPGSSKIISSPVVYNGVVYITNEASKVYAFTADNNGTLIAGYPIVLPIATHGITDVNQQNICGASSPAIATVGSTTYLLVGCDDGYFYRINLGDRTISERNAEGCVESSPSVSGNYAYIGVSIYQGKDVQRFTVEPFEAAGSWDLREESRATVSLAYDYAYNGVDTGHIFYKLHDPYTDPARNTLLQFPASGGAVSDYFIGSAAHTTGGIIYTGNDNGTFYALNANNLLQIAADTTYLNYPNGGIICSSPALGYNVDSNHNRWVFITTRAGGGKLEAFKTVR